MDITAETQYHWLLRLEHAELYDIRTIAMKCRVRPTVLLRQMIETELEKKRKLYLT